MLFDDDTRLAFITSFDGPWDAYMEDFFTSGPTLALFDVIFRHVEGYDGLPDLAAVQGLRPRRRADGRGVRPQLRRHGQGDPEGAARERRVPAGARPPGGRRGSAAPGAAAAARRGRATSRAATIERLPCLTTSPGRAPWPTRSRTSPTSTRSRAPSSPGRLVLVLNTLPFAQPVRPLLRRAALPLPAAAAHRRRRASDRLAVRRRRRRSSCSTASSTPRTRARTASRPRAGGHLHHARRRVGLVPRQRRRGRCRAAACASSPASAGIRSSWTPPPR